mmetsp:Transcript_101919/g.228838  ORF Transcript_101919/g.228838 Transcript_101919/m.228838 type:complete len:209 (+) Transcript_101919:298-924(+)
MTGMSFSHAFSAGRKLLQDTSTHGLLAFVTMTTFPIVIEQRSSVKTWSASMFSSLSISESSLAVKRPFESNFRKRWRKVDGQRVSSQSKMMIVWFGFANRSWESMLMQLTFVPTWRMFMCPRLMLLDVLQSADARDLSPPSELMEPFLLPASQDLANLLSLVMLGPGLGAPTLECPSASSAYCLPDCPHPMLCRHSQRAPRPSGYQLH